MWEPGVRGWGKDIGESGDGARDVLCLQRGECFRGWCEDRVVERERMDLAQGGRGVVA